MDTSTSAYRFLELVALSGEFPADNLHRMGIGENYGEKLVTKLKEEKLLKTHYKDKLRGYRLTSRGKKMLLAQNPSRFSFYLTGSSDTNQPRSIMPGGSGSTRHPGPTACFSIQALPCSGMLNRPYFPVSPRMSKPLSPPRFSITPGKSRNWGLKLRKLITPAVSAYCLRTAVSTSFSIPGILC